MRWGEVGWDELEGELGEGDYPKLNSPSIQIQNTEIDLKETTI